MMKPILDDAEYDGNHLLVSLLWFFVLFVRQNGGANQ